MLPNRSTGTSMPLCSACRLISSMQSCCTSPAIFWLKAAMTSAYPGTVERRKRVQKYGYSVYRPQELDDLAERFPPEIVQLPLNLFDRVSSRRHGSAAEAHGVRGARARFSARCPVAAAIPNRTATLPPGSIISRNLMNWSHTPAGQSEQLCRFAASRLIWRSWWSARIRQIKSRFGRAFRTSFGGCGL